MKLSLTKVCIILFLSLVFFTNTQENSFSADLAIYSDEISSGWADWSWNTTVNQAATSPIHGGNSSMSATFTSAWAGLYLHSSTGIDLTNYDRLTFWIHGGNTGNQQLRVVANGDDSFQVLLNAQANIWKKIDIALSSLGNPTSLSDFYWQDTSGGPQPTFYLDDILLVARTDPPPPPPQPGVGPELRVDVAEGRHQINEDIYGMNYAEEQLALELQLPVRRWGGNSTSRYNWQADVHNTGSDWYFENIPENNPNPSTLPDGSAADRFIEQDRRTGTKTIMTMPLIGWTPKRRVTNHPFDCGFKVSKYGAQQSVDPWDSDCGNGVLTSGSDVTGNITTDTSMAIEPDFVTGWINHLTAKYGMAAAGGVSYYNLDNEPMLWNSTHRDVHPLPATYEEVRDRTYQYGAAIKAADSSAKTLGPVLWGWCAYFYSALDGCSIGSDYQNHESTPFVAWYLQQMKAYDEQHGIRILDFLDLHHYPQASGVALSSAGSSATQSLRLRSTRSLWDPSYKDESWISDTAPGGVAVQMIPRMKNWVNAYYPGTKLAITEYNWGALDHINGALTQADILGIFGREGLDLATLWGPPTSIDPGAYAFRIYRNYDGAGSKFGDVSIQAVSEDQGMLSIYAAQRSSDNALTIIIINKTANALTSSVSLTGMSPRQLASAFRYSQAQPQSIRRLADIQVAANGFNATFAANSITLIVMMPTEDETMILTANKTGNGSGTLASTTPGVTCSGDTCSGSLNYGVSAVITASATNGSTFVGWSGCSTVIGSQCTVIMNDNKTVSATFMMPTNGITVTTPNGGESWKAGSVQTIRWTFSGNPGANVKITLLRNGILARTIAKTTPIGSSGNGSYVWKIPLNQSPRSDYAIRVTSRTSNTYSDTSDGFFAITKR